MKPLTVLFEDDSLLAIDKPSGLITHATVDKNRENLYDLLRERYNTELYLHHRLDKETSGIVLLSKDPSINQRLTTIFKEHLITKIYYAVTRAVDLSEEFTVTNFLKEVVTKRTSHVQSVKSGGKKAITQFKKLATINNLSLYEAMPKTGRMHQIRVHLAEAGLPIIGDTLYGGDANDVGMLLHAKRLNFFHPKTNQEIIIESKLPERFYPFTDDSP